MDVAQIASTVMPIVMQVIAGATKASDAGFFGKLKEIGAVSSFFSEAGEKFKDNGIILAVLGSLTSPQDELQKLDLANLTPDSVIESVGGLDAALADAGDHGTQVKQFVFELAEKVASASGAGFFGGGETISEGEKSFLDTLKAKLGL
jgi:hypothetical protein